MKDKEWYIVGRLALTCVVTLVTSGILIRREFWHFMREWWRTENP